MAPRHKSRGRLDHSTCTTGRSLRESVANDLETMDDDATFRFMDLHTELRLLVYAELLHNDGYDESKKLYPQILATCKAIYNEAHPDFEKNSHLNITIEGGIERREGIEKKFKGGCTSEQLPYFGSMTAYSTMGNWPRTKSLSPYAKLASFRAKMVEQFKSVRRAHLKVNLNRVARGLYRGAVTQQERRRLQLEVACGVGKLAMAICSALRHQNVKVIHLELENDMVTDHIPWFNSQTIFDLMLWPVCSCLKSSGDGSSTMRGIDSELKTLLLNNSKPHNIVPDALGECERRNVQLFNVMGLVQRAGIVDNGTLKQLARATGFLEGTLDTRLVPPPHYAKDAVEEIDRISNSAGIQKLKALALSRLEPGEAAMWAKVT